MKDSILHTENAGIGYRKKGLSEVVASNVNINLERQQLIALVGANGIGKSTLLRTITGIQPALSGKVYLENDLIENYDENTLAKTLSVVLTEQLPPSNLTVRELVALGRQPYTNWMGTLSSVDLAVIENAIELTQIGHLADKKHFEISDGQLQKVLIARALAQDTPLIILDEPTTHLDLVHKAALFGLLKKLSRQPKCILFSTHDIEMAIQLCDQIIVMMPGEIIQGEPQQLIDNGIFNRMFPEDIIGFDNETRKFILRSL